MILSQREIPNPNHGTKRLIELVQGSNGATQGLLGELGITQGQLMLVLGLLAPTCVRTVQGKFTQKMRQNLRCRERKLVCRIWPILNQEF